MQKASLQLVESTIKLENQIRVAIEHAESKTKKDMESIKIALEEQARLTREKIIHRQDHVEQIVAKEAIKVVDFSGIVADLQILFNRDYNEFVRDRKRWKSDFDQAINRAIKTHDDLELMLQNCL